MKIMEKPSYSTFMIINDIHKIIKKVKILIYITEEAE